MAWIAAEDRPFIEFERVLNKGLKGRDAKYKGEKLIRPPRAGESVVRQKFYLIDNMAMNSPYCWARPAWFVERLQKGWKPISVGNLEKLPAKYPAEWAQIIRDCFQVVSSSIDNNARVAMLESKLNEKTVAEPKRGRNRAVNEGLQGAPRAEGEASLSA